MVNCFCLASFGRVASLWPQGISILHSTHLQPVQPSHGWPRQVPQPVRPSYLCSPSCHRSGSPASACTASPGSHPTSLESVAQRCCGTRSRGPSALQNPALAAAARKHTTPPVKAQQQGLHWDAKRKEGPQQKQPHMIPLLRFLFAPLLCYLWSRPVCPPTLGKSGSSHLASLFERMHYPLEIGSLLLCDPGRGTQLFCYWFPSTEKRKGNTALQISLVGAWERDWSRNLTH